MKIKNFAKILSLILFISFPLVGFALQDFESVVIETTPVRDHVSMLTGMGGNLGVSAGEDGVLIIDDQFAPLIPKIEKAIRKLSKQPVKFVVNTHYHPDHTGGNEPLGKTGSIIVAQENVRKRLSRPRFDAMIKIRQPPAPKEALPVITFTRDITFHFNGDTIQVHHVPRAHTDGDSFIYFSKAKVLHSGDLYFNGRYPYIDNQAGGSVDGMIAAADKMLETIPPDAKIIPGHGPLSDVNGLKEYRKMLVTVRDRVKNLKKQGKSQAEVVTAKPTAEFDEKWGKGSLKPDQFVKMVYGGLS